MTTPPEPVPPTQPDGTLDQRVGKLETGQERSESKIDQILGILSKKPEGDAPVTSADPPPPAADMAAQMEAAIRKVNAETAPTPPTSPTPERPPREAGQPFRQRLAGVIHGKEPRKPLWAAC